MPTFSVCVTTYNKPRDLVRVLEGFRRQTFGDFELLVCDDGSGPETKAVIDGFAASVPFRVEHCWQKNEGFRAARSRNNGARAATGEQLVFVDGDCVPWPDFLAQHAAARRDGRFLAGERYLLEPEEADAVSVATIASGAAFAAPPRREVKRVRSIARKDTFYRLVGIKPDRPRMLTANCSVATADFRGVNGFDERHEGWGQEDEDLRRRLVLQGRRCDSVIGRANCLHLWHKADPTFKGKRRMSPNWNYYHRGFLLSCARRGLVERPLSVVTGRVVGPDAALAERVRAALGLAAATSGPRLEVEVLVDPGAPAPAPRASGEAEVTVLLAARPEPARARGAHLVLGPGLEVQGGDLPKEALPAPAGAWAGVRATRPLPGPLDDASLEEARRLLDRLL